LVKFIVSLRSSISNRILIYSIHISHAYLLWSIVYWYIVPNPAFWLQHYNKVHFISLFVVYWCSAVRWLWLDTVLLRSTIVLQQQKNFSGFVILVLFSSACFIEWLYLQMGWKHVHTF